MFRTSARFIRTFASAAIVVCVAAPFAQAGTVSGRVLDSTTSLPLAGVEVLVDGQPTGVTTDFMGQFKAEVAGGDRLFTFRRSGFSEQSQGPVAVPAEGEANVPDAKLAPVSADDDVVMLDALTVSSDMVKGSAGDLQNTRLKADVAIDFLSADEFAKFGASDIAESLIRVPGVSVANGQFAVIRGLSDRYVTTTLNGLKIPSPDPEKQSPQMDILPTSLIDSVVVSKTFAAQLWAETSGGGIDMASKSFPEQREITVSFGLKQNDNATDGGPGYDVRNERRDLLANGTKTRPGPQGAFGRPSSLDVAVQNEDLPIGQRVGIGYGETFAFGDKKLGVNLSGTYDGSSRQRSGRKQRLLLANNSNEYRDGTPTSLDQGTYDYEESETEVSIGLLANVGFEFSPEHRVRGTTFWTRSGIDNVQANVSPLRFYEGADGNTYLVGVDQGEENADDTNFTPQSVQKFVDTQSYTERMLRVNQVAGDHTFPALADLRFSWAAQAASTYQRNPAATEAIYYEQLGENPPGSDDYAIEPGNIGIAPSGTALRRFWSNTTEDQASDRYDFVLPQDLFAGEESRFKFGFAREDTDRSYAGKSDLSNNSGALIGDRQVPASGNIDEIFNDLIEATPESSINRTQQSRNIFAGYLGTELALTEKTQLLGGVRFEDYQVDTSGRDSVEGFSTGAFYHAFRSRSEILGTEFIPALESDAAAAARQVTSVSLAQDVWYPSVGVLFKPAKSVNLRLNFSQTTGRPSMRELGPYYNRSLATGEYVVGNPALVPSDVDNYDARVEWFGESGTMVAGSLFAKTIRDPIEKVLFAGTLNGQSVETWVNNPNEASLYGAEFEFRLGLGLVDDALRRFSFGGNFTYIDATVEENPEIVRQLRANGHLGPGETVERRLFDQPEYLANFDLTWNQERWGTTATLAVNFVSDVLAASGGNVSAVNPEIESSLDLYSRAYERVDFFITQKLTRNLKLRVGVKNLTDPVRGTIYDPERTAHTIIRNEYRVGREYSVSMSASF